MNRLKNEPAVITSVLVAIVGAAATLGIIGTDQQDQLVAAITALVPIIGGLIIRANVTGPAETAALKSRAQAKPANPEPETVAAPADPTIDDATIADDATPDPTPAPEPAPADAPPAPVEDPVKAQLKAAIETVRANSNALNDARAQAAKAAVDASS